MSLAFQAMTQVVPAAAEPIHLDEARAHCRVDADITDEDSLFSAVWIPAARREVEKVLGRALVCQTWELRLDQWPCECCMLLPRAPLIAVESVKYRVADGTLQTFSSSNYIVDSYSQPPRIVLQWGAVWPVEVLQPGPSIVVRFTAGYATPVAMDGDADTFTSSGRELADGDTVELSNSGGSLPNPFQVRTLYHVVNASGAAFQLAATAGGDPIQFEGAGTGQTFAGAIPEDARAAMLLLIAHWYRNREAGVVGAGNSKLEFAVDSLLSDRLWSF